MPIATTVVGIITAVGTLLTALALVINAITARRRDKRIENKVDTVHKIVNQERTDRMNYQRALIRALQDRGIEVPIDQSVEEPEPKHY
jgi:ABC-type transporter MlaC component